MSLYQLEKIFSPTSVAIIGATERPFSVGRSVICNLINGGFQGRIYPINPNRPQILDLKAYPSIGDVGKPIDLVIICTAIETVRSIIEECAKVGVGGAVILSAGGKETGTQGIALEKEIITVAKRSGIRLIGPNCIGISATATRLNASFTHSMPLPGKLAFIAQSGAICSVVLDFANRENIGFSHFVSLGSMIDVDFGDLIDYFGNDPGVSSILLYVEGITDQRKFLSAARAVSRIKPIVVLKSGRSKAGAQAALSHTGALAGEDAVYDAAFKRAGIVRVKLLEDLFGCAELLAKQIPPKGPNLGIITIAGGLGVMAADYLADYGLEPAKLNPETLRKIDEVCPPSWSHSNPMDLTGAITLEAFQSVIETCAKAEEIDASLLIYAPNGLFSSEVFAAQVSKQMSQRHKPAIAVMPGGIDMEEGRKHLNQAGIPTYSSPEMAIRAFHYLYTYQRNLKMLQEIPTGLKHPLTYHKDVAQKLIDEVLKSGRSLMTEVESKQVLEAYGIPTNKTETAPSPSEAVSLARKIGYPVAAKIDSQTITHKSDAGGIKLDLRNADEVIDAFETIVASVSEKEPQAHIGGITIQKMLKGRGVEVILGIKHDPDFGPVILFGMGGVMTELIKDRAIGLPPLNRLLARRMIEETKVYKLLKGYRDYSPANLPLLEEILVRLSQLAVDFPQIVELDINPLLMIGQNAVAVDARIVVKPTKIASPWHMAISCYPAHFETVYRARNDSELLIRPIKPEDAELLVEFYLTLSKETVYQRFLHHVSSLDPEILVRYSQIDYDRDLALVALKQDGETPEMIGVARYFGHPNGTEAEMSIVISDPWQGQLVGAKLMELMIQAAVRQGIQTLWGECLKGNQGMIALCKEMGATVTPVAEGTRLKLSIDLTSD